MTDYVQIFARYPEDTPYHVIAAAEGIHRSTLNHFALEYGLRQRRRFRKTEPNDPFLSPLFKGRTDIEIAKVTGATQQTVSNWRRGANSPRLTLVLKACRAFGLTIDIVDRTALQRIADAVEALRGKDMSGDAVCAELTDIIMDLMEGENQCPPNG